MEGNNGAAVIECDLDGKAETFMPEQIASMVLSESLADAESYLGEPVTRRLLPSLLISMMISVEQLKMLVHAGLEVERVINEPCSFISIWFR